MRHRHPTAVTRANLRARRRAPYGLGHHRPDAMKERGLPLLVAPSDSRGATSMSWGGPVSEVYEGRQVVGMDVHRRRLVLVRMTEVGDRLETVRIVNDPQRLAAVMARAGEAPEGVLEATYGWDWAADTLTAPGGGGP